MADGAGVHIAEVLTTGRSAVAHVRLGNVDRALFVRLLVQGAICARRSARYFAKFFLTLASATPFVLLAGEPGTWCKVAGLVFGGLFAPPFAALLCRRLSARTLMTAVGLPVAFLSAWNLLHALG